MKRAILLAMLLCSTLSFAGKKQLEPWQDLPLRKADYLPIEPLPAPLTDAQKLQIREMELELSQLDGSPAMQQYMMQRAVLMDRLNQTNGAILHAAGIDPARYYLDSRTLKIIPR